MSARHDRFFLGGTSQLFGFQEIAWAEETKYGTYCSHAVRSCQHESEL